MNNGYNYDTSSTKYDIDLNSSWMIGDRPTDVETGINAGTKTILVRSGDPNVTSDQADFIADDLFDAMRYIERQESN